MRVYRVERSKYLESTLSGIGASMSRGFRWNSFNTRLVYTAESRALATLEVSVHLDLSEDLPTDRHYVEIDIPDDSDFQDFYIVGNIEILEVRLEDLPENWNSHPQVADTQAIGDDFASQAETCVLKVPSSIVPQESNFLINPSHPDTKRIKVVSVVPMRFDPRIKP